MDEKKLENTASETEISEKEAEKTADTAETEEIAATEAGDAVAAEAEETAEDSLKECGDHDPEELKGIAPNSVPAEVKKKKPLNKTNIIVIVVCAVIVIACLVFVGFKVGWFNKTASSKGKIELCDLSKIEVVKADVEVTDDTVDYYVQSILSSLAKTEEVADGTVETDDTVNIDYSGVIASTGEAFEGGTASGYDLKIGSGSFITGFEDGLIGKKTGETVELALRFPEEYQNNPDLAGVDVIFTVTINKVSRTTVPELTDEWVKEYSEKYCPNVMTTVQEFKDYSRETVEHFYKNKAVYQYILDNSEIVSYDSEKEAELMEYSNTNLSYYANMYGVDTDTYAQYSGYESAEDFNRKQADEYLKTAMISNAVLKKQGLKFSDEDVDVAITQYLKDQRYIDYYTTEEFKEQSGETWVWLFTNLQFNYERAMESLYDNIVLLDERPTTADEGSTDETASGETTAAN